TANAIEGSAALMTDTLLVLDELGVVDPKDADISVYQLTAGIGKGRANRDGGLRTPAFWRVLIVSTGELSIAAKIAEDKYRKTKAGQQVRIIDVPADAGRGFGVFDGPGPDGDPGKLANAIKRAVRTHYGRAGPAFVRGIGSEGIDTVAEVVNDMVEAFKAANLSSHTDGQVHRVAARLGLIAAAGELATLWGITPWRPGEASEAAARALQDWIQNRGGKEAAEITNAVAQVRRFFEAY